MLHDTAHDAPGDRDYLIRLRPVGDDRRPAVVRLRQALKTLLRRFDLRCVSCREMARSAIDDEPAPIGELAAAIVANLPSEREVGE